MHRLNSLLAACLIGSVALLPAQSPPAPDPGGAPNIYYGSIPPGGESSPVLVFVHGLRGVAQDWWNNNDMYTLAYQAGYRTAFININADGTPNDAGITNNAQILSSLFPQVALRFGVPNFYLVAHSKGGIDSQSAMLTPSVRQYVKAVFTISSPHGGTELADWAFGAGSSIAGPLGLQTPGVFPLQTNNMSLFRSLADNVFNTAGIPFFTLAGDDPSANPLTAITGKILSLLAPGQINDGLVPYPRTKLPISYGTDLGLIKQQHFQADLGNLVLPRINAQIKDMESTGPAFTRFDNGSGMGDRQNSMAWSMLWFKGKLYVGTGRAFLCITSAASDAQTGTNSYTASGPDYECAPSPDDMALRAEIWQFTPETSTWVRVYQSPQDVPIQFDSGGFPTKFTARDAGYPGMISYVESDGTEALYVATMNAGSVFAYRPPYNQNVQYPAPRLLRSVDGVTFNSLSQTPGTFLGDIANPRPNQIVAVRGFGSMEVYKGKLFVTVTDYLGTGFIIASANPKAGDNAWFMASPSAETLPVSKLKVFNGSLYATTGTRTPGVNSNGYGVYKTDASSSSPYVFTPVVTDGAGVTADARAPYAPSMAVFGNKLYVGTDRPTELIRINPDDSWDLVVGTPRTTAQGLKLPLSGFVTGFGNLSNGHFWTMSSTASKLTLGTWDWSVELRTIPAMIQFFGRQFGFDMYSTSDGVNWNIESINGFGDKFNYGVRNLVETPFGTVAGTANPFYGMQIWKSSTSIPTRSSSLAAPAALKTIPLSLSSRQAALSWRPVDGAVRYQVFRIDAVPADQLLPANAQLKVRGAAFPVTVSMIKAGFLDSYCARSIDEITCSMADLIRKNSPVRGAAHSIGFTTGTTYNDLLPSGVGQAIYFVRAEDSRGNLSPASNVAGGPIQ